MKIVQETQKHIVGIEVRTQHTHAMKDIPALWQRFGTGEVFAKVAGLQQDPYIYAVYCDYVSDFTGPYTLVLGLAVAEGVTVSGLRSITIAAGKYAERAVDGNPAEVINSAWHFINDAWTEKHSRLYGTDFECYDAASTPQHCLARVCVGVRS